MIRYRKALLFMAPQIGVTILFFILPAAYALMQSMQLGDVFGIYKKFAGLENFLDLLKSPGYLDAVWVTAVIAFLVTIFTMSFGLILAILVIQRKKSQGTYKTLLIWPYAVAPAVAAILWRFLCHPTLGWVTSVANFWGIEFNYMTNVKQALFVIILTASWQQFSYNFLFFFAALRSIPTNLIEAAVIDGASAWRRFWQIIFPLLSPTSFFLLIMNLIYGIFETFGIIHVITKGGPGSATTTLMYKVYEDGFIGMDVGSAAAQSVILMLMVLCLTIFQFRYLEKKVHYQ